ncbi:hypothetical protein BC781_102171 [Sediminitomix flava]|uniref:Uncharacterized protein n=1 Tax=Sediminitomix flava TaxID=379075 RepID=A0A315ZZ29_SEDFL|nr:hypothetical protein BC781_102171 [Sediminitomix flava]
MKINTIEDYPEALYNIHSQPNVKYTLISS